MLHSLMLFLASQPLLSRLASTKFSVCSAMAATTSMLQYTNQFPQVP